MSLGRCVRDQAGGGSGGAGGGCAGGKGEEESEGEAVAALGAAAAAPLSQACWPLHGRSRAPSFMSCGRRGAQGISLGEGVGVGWCREGALSRRQFDQSTPSHVRRRGGRAPCSLPLSPRAPPTRLTGPERRGPRGDGPAGHARGSRQAGGRQSEGSDARLKEGGAGPGGGFEAWEGRVLPAVQPGLTV